MNYKTTISKNLKWFQKSGIMSANHGEWGVAERLAILDGNAAKDKIMQLFPAWSIKDGYCIIEHRRSDCNFETALAFLLSYELTGNQKEYQTALNILDFLYFRSGLLNRSNTALPNGAWNWSHINWGSVLWVDDNGWVAALQIVIGRRHPELDARFNCRKWGGILATELLAGFNRIFDSSKSEKDFQPLDCSHDPQSHWLGRLTLPHWGIPMVAAFMAAYVETNNDAYRVAIMKYAKYCELHSPKFNSSELAYLLLMIPFAAELFPAEKSLHDFSNQLIQMLTAKIKTSQYDNLPSEHFETPNGPHLVDLIYTVNWAFLGWVNLAGLSNKAEDREIVRIFAELLAKIQDDSSNAAFNGCWRGLYDLNDQKWGGGDRYEGGAGSIYSGWTNAPIVIGFLLNELNLTFKELINEAF